MNAIDTRYVQFFDGRIAPDHDQLGGKCASLVTMTAAGMPVPPGFAVTTASYDAFIADDRKAIATEERPPARTEDLLTVDSLKIELGYGLITLIGDGRGAFGRGSSTVTGGPDTLDGGNGNDTLYGDGIGETLNGGDDTLRAGSGNDTLFGDGEAYPRLVGGNDTLKAGAGNDIAYGDGIVRVTYGGPAELTGGDDCVDGSSGNDVLYGEGLAFGAGFRAIITGGDDILQGGSGNDVIYGDGEATGSGATLTGGNDLITGGSGNDVLWGDGLAIDTYQDAPTLAGGADTFVFAPRQGIDTVMDFRHADGDLIDLVATGLTWDGLDSDGSGILDDADLCVADDGSSTAIDLGAALGGRANLHVVTFAGVTGLTDSDFLFA